MIPWYSIASTLFGPPRVDTSGVWQLVREGGAFTITIVVLVFAIIALWVFCLKHLFAALVKIIEGLATISSNVEKASARLSRIEEAR